MVAASVKLRALERKADQIADLILSAQPKFSLDAYQSDPIGFIENELGTILTTEQKQIAIAVRDKAEMNVQAAHGVGKTRLAACLALWFIFVLNGLVISTAPTKRQVNELLWGEIRKLYDDHRIKLGGERGQTFLRLTETARGFGFTASHYSPDAFQGIHAERLLVIEDEANGISPEIDDGASACVTGSQNRILRIGNPTVAGTPFEKACRGNHIRVPVWNHPNVAWAYVLHDDGIHRLKSDIAALILDDNGYALPQVEWPEHLPRDVIPGAVSIGWIERMRQKKGEASSYWQSRVEGYFPEAEGNSIVPRSWFLAARARYDNNPHTWDALAAKHKWRHGLDVGDGGDPHAIASWRGPVLYAVSQQITRGDREDVTRAANLGWKTLNELPGDLTVDQIGVGAGTLSDLLTRQKEWADAPKGLIRGCNFGARPDGIAGDEFVVENLKADLYLAFRESVRSGNVAIAPLGAEMEEMLIEGFSQTFYEETTTGRFKIEPKKKTKKRLGRSTDPEDAVVMAFGTQPAPQSGAALILSAM